jgi:hypothetical protein
MSPPDGNAPRPAPAVDWLALAIEAAAHEAPRCGCGRRFTECGGECDEGSE